MPMVERSRAVQATNAPSSFWSRTFSVCNGRVTLRLYFDEVNVSAFGRLFEEAVGEFDQLAVPHDSVVLTSNRAGMHFCNFFRMEPDAADALGEKLEGLGWEPAAE